MAAGRSLMQRAGRFGRAAPQRRRRPNSTGDLSMISPIKIDSKGNRKRHTRHVAVEVTREGAKTKCNRLIKSYWEAEQTGYFYTDGSRYAHPCRTCLPDEYGAYQADYVASF